ncbi:MAG: hypothetical protein AB7P40_30420 [Chloroflexota bacterium]
MYGGERPRKPVRVVVLVLGFWILGNILEMGFGLAVNETGLVSDAAVVWIGRILGWGLLFAFSLVYRERLDAWLRRA